MGIKFHCPQGHKLNVKAFLAGKKGICPKCGTKVRIPDVSEAGLVDSEDDDSDGSDAVAKSNGASAAVIALNSPAPAAPAVSAAPANAAVASGPNDPIAEAPAAIWYVRPPSGGQYGPARGDVMRKWLAEGRVSSESLVWREGWTDWQNAGKLFPTLNQAGTSVSAQASGPVVATTAPVTIRSGQRAATRHESKKRDSSAMALAILAVLGVLCLILVIVLVFVVMRMSRSA